jgi:Transposase
MKRKRFRVEQIILREHELGARTADLCRKHGISEATFYNGRASSAAWTYPKPNGRSSLRGRMPG